MKKETLTRVHHRLNKDEQKKAAEYATKQRMKSCEKYNGVTNRELTKDKKFLDACSEAKVEPTKRQASKYRRGFGQAKRTALGV